MTFGPAGTAGGGFALYFAAHDSLTRLQCVGVANSSSAAGMVSGLW